jgi:uncharacterized protein DUF6923
MNRITALLVYATLSTVAIVTANASPVIWIDDSSGNLGTVDIGTHQVTVIGDMGDPLTDIAFAPNGNLYGVDFNSLFQINPTNAVLTYIGATGVSVNALVFGTNGTLYSASPSAANLYTINLTTGAATPIGATGFTSAGDLAFNGGQLYLSSSASQLIQLNFGNTVLGTNIGNIGFANVFGLATADNGVLYGVAGTDVLSIDTATGAGTLLFDYSGHGLGAADGSAFITEAVIPEPATGWLCILGMITVGLVVRRTRRPVTVGSFDS